MIIDRSSWHYRFLACLSKRSDQSDIPRDLCRYIRAMLVWPLAYAIRGFFTAMFVLFWFVGAALFVWALFAVHYANFTGQQLELNVFILGTCANFAFCTFGVVYIVQNRADRRREAELYGDWTPERFPVFKAVYRDWREKTCTRLEFKGNTK